MKGVDGKGHLRGPGGDGGGGGGLRSLFLEPIRIILVKILSVVRVRGICGDQRKSERQSIQQSERPGRAPDGGGGVLAQPARRSNSQSRHSISIMPPSQAVAASMIVICGQLQAAAAAAAAAQGG